MSNTSATGGYLRPSATLPLPGGLTLGQFLHTVLTGITGLDPTLIRPKYQQNPPKSPGVDENWLAFSVQVSSPDANGYTSMRADGTTDYSRHETIQVQCSFYGPLSFDTAAIVRDGFQIQQNLDALRAANMGFVEVQQANLMPDLVHERWVQRVEQLLVLRRQIQRTYPILSIVGANGTIHAPTGGEDYLLPWATPEEDEAI